MKRSIIIILGISILFYSCNTNIIDPLEKSDNYVEVNDNGNLLITKSTPSLVDTFDVDSYPYTIQEDSVYISELYGYISHIQDVADAYLINGEVLFYKQNLLNDRDTRQPRLFGNTLHPKYQRIYFSIHSETYDDDYAKMFASALDEWNSLSECNLYFASFYDEKYSGNIEDWPMVTVYLKPDVDDSQIYNDAECDIKYGIVTDAPHALGKVGYQIAVDTSSDSEFYAMSKGMQKYALMHSIGHVIGLKEVAYGISLSDLIHGTNNTYDTFMRSYNELEKYGLEWEGFTKYDRQDLSLIYPVVVDEIELIGPNESELLKQYKPYIFKSAHKSIKSTDKIYYTYDIITQHDGSYNCETLSDGTFKVAFNKPGVYKVRTTAHSNGCVLPDVCTDEKTYTIIGEQLDMPSKINVNEDFYIYWRYPDHTNPENPEARIEVSGIETIFDNNNKNILLDQQDGTIVGRITDYGKYIITMTAFASDGTILKQKKINIDKFYKPVERGYVSEYERLGFYPECFSIDGEVCTSDLSAARYIQTINNAYEILFMVTDKLPARFCVYRYNKYRILSGFPRRIDVRDLVDTTSYTPITFNKGDFPVYDVSAKHFEIDSEEIGMKPSTTTKFICYYAFIIPDSKIYVTD